MPKNGAHSAPKKVKSSFGITSTYKALLTRINLVQATRVWFTHSTKCMDQRKQGSCSLHLPGYSLSSFKLMDSQSASKIWSSNLNTTRRGESRLRIDIVTALYKPLSLLKSLATTFSSLTIQIESYSSLKNDLIQRYRSIRIWRFPRIPSMVRRSV